MMTFVGCSLAGICMAFSVISIGGKTPDSERREDWRDASFWAIACALFLLVAK